MSQIPQPIEMLPLFAPPEPERVKLSDVHAQAEREHAEFFEQLRFKVGLMFGETGMAISTDEVRTLMDREGIEFPAGASPSIMGTFFSGWSRAEATGKLIRSRRKGAGGNLISTWIIR